MAREAMHYLIVDRRLARLDGSVARFTQRRQLTSCPPSPFRGSIGVILLFGTLPWLQRINPAPDTTAPSVWFAFAWSGALALVALVFRGWRARERAAFIREAHRLGADIDVGACPAVTSALGSGRSFVVEISLRDASAVLMDADGSMLERAAAGSVIRGEQTGHAFPWSDANEGDPHDTATIYLLVGGAASEDLSDRFILSATSIDDPDLPRVRLLVERLPDSVATNR